MRPSTLWPEGSFRRWSRAAMRRCGEAQCSGDDEHHDAADLNDERLVGKGGGARILEAEEPVLDRDEEADQRSGGEAQPHDGGPHPAQGDDQEAEHQAGDGLEQEEGTDGRNMPVLLPPQVEMDIAGPHQEEAAGHERHRGRHLEGRRGPAGPVIEDGEVHAHPSEWEVRAEVAVARACRACRSGRSIRSMSSELRG